MTWNLDFGKIETALASEGLQLPSLAIETGTLRGNGTKALARKFAQVITIELGEALHAEARERLKSAEYTHVKFVRGNSAHELPNLLRELTPAQPVFFFLDAHWSGDSTVDWDKAKWKGYGVDTAKSEEQCPLATELTAIVEYCQGPAVILIDDMKNLPATGPGLKNHEFPGENWSNLSQDLLRSILNPRLSRIHELESPSQWLVTLR